MDCFPKAFDLDLNTHPLLPGFPGGASGKGPTCQCRDKGWIPGSGRFPGEGHGNLL